MTVLEPGRYLCIQTTGLASTVIQWATHSRMAHTAVVLPPGDRIAEAEPEGVIDSPLSKYAGMYVRANLLDPMTPAQLETVWKTAEGLKHTPYNWAAISGDAALFLHWRWRWLLRLAADDHDLDCSQMAAYCGSKAGLNWLCGQPTYCQVTPGDLDRRPGMARVRIQPLKGRRPPAFGHQGVCRHGAY